MKLFAYGSLLSPESAERALQRRFAPGDLEAAELPGYRLTWHSVHRVHTPVTGDIDASFLNVEAADGFSVPGQLLAINEAEFARLRRREKGYSVQRLACRKATGQIVPAMVFVDERPMPSTQPPVLAGYLAKIRAGLEALAPDFTAAYLAALPDPPLPLVEGDYHFVDPEQKANT